MKKHFERKTFIRATAEQVLAYHAEAGALKRLLPPLAFIEVIRDERLGLTHGEFEFRQWLGPLPLRWLVRHEPGPIETAFIDRMLRGPFAEWMHEHIFQPIDGGTKLIDRITFEHKRGWAGLLTRLVFSEIGLRFGFAYRHWRTRRDLEGKIRGADDAAGR